MYGARDPHFPLRNITILQFLPFRRPQLSKFRCPRPAYSAELRELAPEPRIFHFAAALRG